MILRSSEFLLWCNFHASGLLALWHPFNAGFLVMLGNASFWLILVYAVEARYPSKRTS